MPCCKYKDYGKRLLDWWRQPINPVFLYFRDEALQAEYEDQLYKRTSVRLKYLTPQFWLIIALFTLI